MNATSSTALTVERESSRSKLRDYQNQAVSWIHQHPNCGLFAGMGMGKTIAALTAIQDLVLSFDVNRILIVAPLRVALNTWSDEIEAWDHISGVSYKVLAGLAPLARAKAAKGKEDIHIINRENLVWLVTTHGDNWPYDMVVLDESRSFKNHQSKRFKALRKVRQYITRVVELTGTPAPNGLLDLWAQLAILDRGARLGRTRGSFLGTYFESDYMGYNWTPKIGSSEIIQKKISDICLSMEAADYMDIPETIINKIEIDIPKKARGMYDDFAKEYILEFQEGEDIVASTAAVLRQKLHQVANGFVYGEEKEVTNLHDAKLDALADVIEEANGMPVLVAYTFTADRDKILAKFSNARQLDQDPETIRSWNRGEIPILVAHPASCGHGLSLQHGGNILTWYGLTDDLELYQQMNERLGAVRQKQSGYNRPAFVHLITAKDTVDDLIFSSNTDKALTQGELMEALKTQIENR